MREEAGCQLPSSRLTYVGTEEEEEDVITDLAPGRQTDRCI